MRARHDGLGDAGDRVRGVASFLPIAMLAPGPTWIVARRLQRRPDVSIFLVGLHNSVMIIANAI